MNTDGASVVDILFVPGPILAVQRFFVPGAISVVVVTLVALSRLYLGVHYLGDVLGGALILLVLVAVAAAVFVLLALGLQGAPGTPLDIAVTRQIQLVDDPTFALAMWTVSAFGWAPLNVLPYVAIVGGLWLADFRRDALFVALAPLAGVVSGGIKLLVSRPRPDADLVRVVSELLDYSFPSGHVVSYVSFFGFLFFLAYVRFRPSTWRTTALVAWASWSGSSACRASTWATTGPATSWPATPSARLPWSC